MGMLEGGGGTTANRWRRRSHAPADSGACSDPERPLGVRGASPRFEGAP
jgi:hypothetical protein